MRAALVVCVGITLAGCATPDPLATHVQGCANAGYPPGGSAFAQCMSRAASAPPMPADEVRERRRWEARLLRERIDAEARVRQERSMVGLNRN